MSSEHHPGSFLEAMQDVKPLKPDNTVHVSQTTSPSLAQKLKKQAIEQELESERNPLSLELLTNVAPYDFISYKKDGVQQGVFKNLRLGKYPIESRINIQALNAEKARVEVFNNLSLAQDKGLRLVIVQHGLGLKNKPQPAMLKSYLNQWLPQLPQVLAFHTAAKAHGGLSATYVLLKKSEQQKLENRELHRKK